MAKAIRDAQGFILSIESIPEDEDFIVYGTVHAWPDHADTLESVYAETTRLARDEPGTLYYCICRDQDDPTIFHMFERYKGKAGFDAHNRQLIIQKLLNEWKYIKGVKAWFPSAELKATVKLPDH